jgi:hypothetical protein
VEPPFVPKTTGVHDTQNVDDDFLGEMPEETPILESELTKNMNRDSQGNDYFTNFSFVNQENLESFQTGASSNSMASGAGEQAPAQRRKSFEEENDD